MNLDRKTLQEIRESACLLNPSNPYHARCVFNLEDAADALDALLARQELDHRAGSLITPLECDPSKVPFPVHCMICGKEVTRYHILRDVPFLPQVVGIICRECTSNPPKPNLTNAPIPNA